MLHSIRTYLPLFALLLGMSGSPGTVHAQGKSDLELWTGAGVKLDVKKRWRLGFSFQHRRDNAWVDTRYNFVEAGARVKLWKMLYLASEYRVVFEPAPDENRGRWSMDFLVRHKFKKASLTIRNRLRYQYGHLFSQPLGQHTWRNRLGVEYNLSKLVDPSLSGELFYTEKQLDKFRVRVGLEWRIIKPLSLETFYGFERELFRKNNDMVHIVGVTADWTFKIKKRKKSGPASVD